MQNLKMVPMGFQQIVAATLAASSPLIVPAGATVALLNAETADVRWRDDGAAPTASIGMLIVAGGDPYEYWGDLTKIRFILASGSPLLNISYYRVGG